MTLVSLVKFDLIAIVFAESMVEFELGVCFSTLKKPQAGRVCSRCGISDSAFVKSPETAEPTGNLTQAQPMVTPAAKRWLFSDQR